jgi:DNA (cytosine-5)-methyltransferase 1
MLDGKVYELPMQALPINDSEFSSLPTLKARDHQAEGYEAGLRRATPQLGTIVKGIVDGDNRVFELLRSPTASQGQGGALGEAEARRRGNTVGIRDQAMDIAKAQGLKVTRSADNLFPTPNTMDHLPARSPEKIAESKLRTPGGYSNVRETVVNDLFPTPVASEGTKAPSQQTSATKSKTGQVWLSNVAKDLEQTDVQRTQTNWGKFEPAIRRWEAVIGRQAPEPTKPDGKEGNHRLSSKFTEWMMGLPDGWITDIGLKRNDELKACGNGVVPQQAELALSLLGIKEILEKN